MSYMDHLKTCYDCQQREANNNQNQKPTIRIKAASSYRRERKLSGLGALITGASYPSLEPSPQFWRTKTKAASSVEKSQKLKELARLTRGH